MIKVEITKECLAEIPGITVDSFKEGKSYIINALRVTELCGGCCGCPHGLGAEVKAEVKIVEPINREGAEMG